jgi:hypothetical protein
MSGSFLELVSIDSSSSSISSIAWVVFWYTNLKKMRARADPPKLDATNIGAHVQLSVVGFQNTMAKAIAGFTGLASIVVSLMPARSIAPR